MSQHDEAELTLVWAAMVIFGISIGVTLLPAIGVDTPRQQSEYTGYVVDVEYNKGMVFRTTQVILKTHPRSSETEEFCVAPGDEQAILPAARAALRNQSRVQVSYSRPLWVSPADCQPTLSTVDEMETVQERESE